MELWKSLAQIRNSSRLDNAWQAVYCRQILFCGLWSWEADAELKLETATVWTTPRAMSGYVFRTDIALWVVVLGGWVRNLK